MKSHHFQLIEVCSIHKRHHRPNLVHVRLIIHQFSFFFLVHQCTKLPSLNSIPSGNSQSLSQSVCRTHKDLYPDHSHCWVYYSQVSFNCELTFLVYLNKSHQHVPSWNSNLVEWHKSIVFWMVSKLRANVSAFNSWKEMMSVLVSCLYNEWLYSIELFLNDKSGKD
jgi:hypothetical protein